MTDETKYKISKAKTAYRKKYCKAVVAYFEKTLADRRADGAIKRVPSYVAFARQIGVTARTIENWRNKYEEFGEACYECDALLREAIIGEGLCYRMHASFAKFLLSSRYGMREKVEITKDNQDITVPKEMEEMILQRARREKQ